MSKPPSPSHRSLSKPSRSSSDNNSLDSRTSSASHLNDSFATRSPTLDPQQWHAAAMSMGIAPNVTDTRMHEAARKLTKKVDKRAKKMAEVMTTAIESVTASHRELHLTTDNLCNRECIPSFVPSLDSTSARRMGLLPPRPAITVGYLPKAFTGDQRELQYGIISDIDGAPRDLGKLSHACRDTYWPFFVAEISDVSLQAASDLVIEATSSCNNAVMTLASALLNPTSTEIDAQLVKCVNRSIACFGLAIYKKTARLITHYCDGFIGEMAGIIQSYNLDSEAEMSAMLRRIQSIFIWAEDVRLKAITELLDVLDRRVNFRECVKTQDTSNKGPMDLPGVGRTVLDVEMGRDGRGKSPGGLLKSVVGSSMPKWSRVEI